MRPRVAFGAPVLVGLALGACAYVDLDPLRTTPRNAEAGRDAADEPGDASPPEASTDATSASGCGRAQPPPSGYVSHRSARGEDRRYYVSLPASYDASRRYPVVFGLHGRDFDGKRMRDYLGLEQSGNDWAIFVYPDALSRTFATETAIGWELGPVSSSYAGPRDVEFFEEMVRALRTNYCVDDARVFATGQSWGADFSLLLGCIRGDLVAGVVAVGGAGDYFLPKDTNGKVACPTGAKAFWGMHGKGDIYFAEATYGRAYRDGYLLANRCPTSSPTPLAIAGGAAEDECWEYAGCTKPTRWCSYAAAYGHQIPSAYYARETTAFLRGL